MAKELYNEIKKDEDMLQNVNRLMGAQSFIPNATGGIVASAPATAGTGITTIRSINLIINTDVETNVILTSIPGNTLGTSGGIRIKLYPFCRGNGGGTLTFRIYYGNTLVATSTNAFPPTMSTQGGYIDAHLIANNSKTSQEGDLQIFLIEEGSASTVLTQTYARGNGFSSEDSAATLDLKITAQFSIANVGNYVGIYIGTIEIF